MRDTAIFAYVVAVLVLVALMIFTFAAIASGHSDWVPFAMIPGILSFLGLWGMAHWIYKAS